MSAGPHYHEWHYEDSRTVIVNMQYQERVAGRYCTQCGHYEEVKLKENNETLRNTTGQ